eukprot:8427873-Alexandrium_andersonii.AAC.1
MVKAATPATESLGAPGYGLLAHVTHPTIGSRQEDIEGCPLGHTFPRPAWLQVAALRATPSMVICKWISRFCTFS